MDTNCIFSYKKINYNFFILVNTNLNPNTFQ